MSKKFQFDVDHHLEKAAKGEVLPETSIKVICSKVKEIFENESNVVQVQSPVTVVGDVHG
jgi:serine/threonine-protein phosphatase PPG1